MGIYPLGMRLQTTRGQSPSNLRLPLQLVSEETGAQWTITKTAVEQQQHEYSGASASVQNAEPPLKRTRLMLKPTCKCGRLEAFSYVPSTEPTQYSWLSIWFRMIGCTLSDFHALA